MSPAQASTRRQIFAYALIVAPVGVLPWLLGFASAGYGVVAAALGAGFVWYAWKVLRMPDGDRAMQPAKALFAYSLLYLFAHLRRLSGRRGRRSARWRMPGA